MSEYRISEIAKTDRMMMKQVEQLLEEISFNVSDMDAEKIEITPAMVKEKLSGLVENRDIRRYLL